MQYEDKDGQQRSSCGPCSVSGTGGWDCPAVGSAGPVEGSTLTTCLSQCDVICPGPPDCAPTVAPPPPPLPPSPGIVQVAAPPDAMLSALVFVPMPTVNPYKIQMAAVDAMKAAGYSVTTAAPPKVYFPVVVYRSPMDYQPFTTVPPIPPALLQEDGVEQYADQVQQPEALRPRQPRFLSLGRGR